MGRKRSRPTALPTTRSSMVERCTAAGIVPRAVIANDRGAVGVVVDVRDDGTFTIAYRRGQWGEGRIGDAIEILAAPDEWHAGRLVILQDWQRRPPDWPAGRDDVSDAFARVVWESIMELAARYGLTLGEEIVVDLHVSRPRVRVPRVLMLTAAEMREHVSEPFDPEGPSED
jgi:hypothetical protein